MAVTADTMKKQTGNTGEFQKAYSQRQQASQNNINNTMDTSLGQNTQSLQDAYNQNLAARNTATQAGQQAYTAGNANLGVQVNRNRTGLDSYADVRQMNKGKDSQQDLMMNMARNNATANLQAKQQQAMQESQRQQDLLKANYNNQVQQAIKDMDYKKAAALLDDYNNQQTWLEKQAAQMAQYGNFSGYEQLYGPTQAATMRDYWIGANPELAYNTGAINAEKYKQLTGRETPDYVPTGWGGSGGGNPYGMPGLYNDDGTPKAGADAYISGSSSASSLPFDAVSGAAPSLYGHG